MSYNEAHNNFSWEELLASPARMDFHDLDLGLGLDLKLAAINDGGDLPQYSLHEIDTIFTTLTGDDTGDDIEHSKMLGDQSGEQSIPDTPRFPCPRCPASYKRAGGLVRHQSEKHDPPKFLCPIDKCPRGIEGEGFGRMHHLVTHLTTHKHGMGKIEAMFLARQFNKPKSKARHVQQQGSGKQRKSTRWVV